MLDIGFWEITLIAVVALIVVGPDKFPGLVRNIGRWVGRFRQIVGTVKSELAREVDKAEKIEALMNEQVDIVKRHEQPLDDKPTVPVQGKSILGKPVLSQPRPIKPTDSHQPSPSALPSDVSKDPSKNGLDR